MNQQEGTVAPYASFDEALSALRDFECKTKTKYCMVRRKKQPESFSGGTLHWQTTKDSQCAIPFDGMPFILKQLDVLKCHTTGDCCAAKAAIRHVVVFPEYKISQDTKLLRRIAVAECRNHADNALREDRFYLSLPLSTDHDICREHNAEFFMASDDVTVKEEDSVPASEQPHALPEIKSDLSSVVPPIMIILPVVTSEQLTVVPATTSEHLPVVPARTSEQLPVVPATTSEHLPVVPARTSEQLPVVPATSERSPVVPATAEQLPVVPARTSEQLPVVPATSERSPVVPATAEQLPVVPAAQCWIVKDNVLQPDPDGVCQPTSDSVAATEESSSSIPPESSVLTQDNVAVTPSVHCVSLTQNTSIPVQYPSFVFFSVPSMGVMPFINATVPLYNAAGTVFVSAVSGTGDSATPENPAMVPVPDGTSTKRNNAGNSKAKVKRQRPRIAKVPKEKRQLKRYPCDLCDKIFKSRLNLVAHERVHTGERPYACRFCTLSFAYQSSLSYHESTHGGEPFLHCSVCDKAFNHKKKLVNHQLLHAEKRFPCKTCGMRFKLRAHLQYHERKHTGERPFMCDVCGIMFANRAGMEYHIKSHTTDRPHQCGLCSKTFAQKTILKTHIKNHTSERWYCHFCAKSFRQKKDLDGHIRTHTGERPFHCGTCEKSFSQKRYLVTHERTHSDLKLFFCGTCSKAFPTKKGTIRHELTHAGIKPFVCDVCGMAFSENCGLTRHRRIHDDKLKLNECISV